MRHFKLLIIVLLLVPVLGFSQKKKPWNKPLYDSYRWHFGFAFSFGVLDFTVKHSEAFNTLDSVYSVTGIARPIFGANVVGNLKLNDHLDLRLVPGLSFGQRDLEYLVCEPGVNGADDQFYTHNMKIESTLLQFPLLLKYRAVRENNYRPYLLFGGSYLMDLATRKRVAEEEKPKIRLKRHDLTLELGFGIDYYLPYFKFSTELRFSYGFLNIADDDGTQFTEVYDRLGNKMITLVIYFE